GEEIDYTSLDLPANHTPFWDAIVVESGEHLKAAIATEAWIRSREPEFDARAAELELAAATSLPRTDIIRGFDRLHWDETIARAEQAVRIGWALATTYDIQWSVEEWCQRAMAKAEVAPMPIDVRAAYTARVGAAYDELERVRKSPAAT
ncbi:MAG TPA: hypothetical protein VKT80_01870, partial [Chloroflexota bacterium]|nr:hypothetical protein [Chloroflexota bacterium]